MPITNTRFENGILYARETGDISKHEAEQWASELRKYALTSPQPIAAVIDALDVKFVSAGARIVLADASHTPNLKVIAVAAYSTLTMQTARMIGMLGERGTTHVFATYEDAESFARDLLNQIAHSR
jgi:hypothetical protein